MQKLSYNIKCIIEYDGTNFYGFQIQPGVRTVEGELNKTLSNIFNEDIKVIGSGRTDRGVHAKGQVINFVVTKKIPLERLFYAINKQIVSDIRVVKLRYVPLDFHARFSSKKKEYRYYIKTKNFSAFDFNYYDYETNLDVELMSEAIKLFIGTYNFKGFSACDINPLKDCTKTIFDAHINVKRNELEFVFIGTGFLKYQIRKMMSLLIEIGKKREKIETITYILETQDRLKFTKVANPNGLYLYHVYY